MPKPVGKFALMNGYRWTQVSAIEPSQPLYDKQALIDLLEEAAKECESRQTPNTGSVAILNGAADAIRKLKETL